MTTIPLIAPPARKAKAKPKAAQDAAARAAQEYKFLRALADNVVYLREVQRRALAARDAKADA